MAITDLALHITELLEPLAEEHGYELVAVEQSGGKHTPVIRVLLDREGGVDLDTICTANKWVSEALDEKDPVHGPYTLEVSSPGIDRPLRKLIDFDRFAGETVTVKTKTRGKDRSAWTGLLVGTEGEDIVIDVEGERVVVAYDEIVKARLKGAVSFESRRDED